MPAPPSLQQAYKWWLLGGFGLLGLHRRYLRKPRTAMLWLCTAGFFGIGALLDLFLLHWLVNRMHMIHRIKELQSEIEKTAAHREQLAAAHQYEEAAYNRDKELLLRRRLEQLRLQLRQYRKDN
ncbi:TM2 domain-containing protein [Flaviaesturariibacter flavus]|uniref:TM2 domain-containing protein n=1 Tax=Flaviaesturariibacter flavus TaxID=2502780 RepID=A0A4R1B8T7_9BACT|nr:TM2 domain-containing protein [Flaviaesturariibacter flavus]TCJ13285.1 TM2 domain-containing protein [Flaviaesturariibacter flavus]